jgi:hypothetical protein
MVLDWHSATESRLWCSDRALRRWLKALLRCPDPLGGGVARQPGTEQGYTVLALAHYMKLTWLNFSAYRAKMRKP